jgi:replicative DNA helicase
MSTTRLSGAGAAGRRCGRRRRLCPAAFDRQPPQDLAAEQAVLGGMLMSKDATAHVIEALRSGDFQQSAHTLCSTRC